uniref:Reverse transcriptase domain-containing protein n=1 Tax=Tanacetum cinerariifolium TaxID=118510 RepID=A0A6L2JI85_TANCI|nr:hypothetical protein [Tanacetum cinerariifolium]
MSTETSNGLAAIQAQLNNLGIEIMKVNEKVYDAQVGCEQCKGPHYTKDYPVKEEGKTLEEAYYTKFGAPFQGGRYGETALGFYQRNNTRGELQFDQRDLSFNGCCHKKPRASNKTLEIQIGQISKVLQEKGFGSLPSSTETNPTDHVKSISTIVEADTSSIRRMGSSQYTVSTRKNSTLMTMKYPKGIAKYVLVGIGKFVFPVDFIILDMPEGIKVPLILERPFLSTARAKIDVFKKKITLRVGEEKIIFKSVKPASSLIKRVYMLSLRERIEFDLEARLIGETLVLNRSLNPFFRDYIKLNDLNGPFELRRDQVDDLMPTIVEGEVVEELRARNDARMEPSEHFSKSKGIWTRNAPNFNVNMEDDVDINMLTIEQYLAWVQDDISPGVERYNDSLFKCSHHDLNCQQKVHIFYTRLNIPTHKVLDSKGFIPLMTPTQALISIQVMTEHSHDWYDEATTREQINDSPNNVNTKKSKENIHAIQVSFKNYEGAHLTMEYPLEKEDKAVEQSKTRETICAIGILEEIKDYKGDMNDGCDITVEDVERPRKIFTPPIHALPNLKLIVQPYMPLGLVYNKAKVIKEEEQDYDIPLYEHVMQPLTPQTVRITPPDNDYVASATNPILNKHLNEFGEEFADNIMISENIDSNPVNDLKKSLNTYDFENFIQKLKH